MSSQLLHHPQAIEIKIGTIDLASKIDVIGAAVVAVREAHRDGMSGQCWAAMNRAQEALAEALMSINADRALRLPASSSQETLAAPPGLIALSEDLADVTLTVQRV